jgi:hypothetical protein
VPVSVRGGSSYIHKHKDINKKLRKVGWTISKKGKFRVLIPYKG